MIYNHSISSKRKLAITDWVKEHIPEKQGRRGTGPLRHSFHINHTNEILVPEFEDGASVNQYCGLPSRENNH